MTKTLFEILKGPYPKLDFVDYMPFDERSDLENDNRSPDSETPPQGQEPKDNVCDPIELKPGEKLDGKSIRDDAKYFIDGVRNIRILGHFYDKTENRSYPVLYGDIVASCGEIHKKSFKIVASRHILAFALPNLDSFPEETTEEIKSFCEQSGLEKLFDTIELRFYSPNTTGNRSIFSVAKKLLQDRMLEAEHELLENVWSSVKERKNSFIFVDGRFDEKSSIDYRADKVLSLCKEFSIESCDLSAINALSCESPEKQHTKPEEKDPPRWRWFMKLRNDQIPKEIPSDILLCTSAGKPEKEVVEEWVGRLNKLAWPTCYGLDRWRWRTHIYPIFLTETYSHQMQVNEERLKQMITNKY